MTAKDQERVRALKRKVDQWCQYDVLLQSDINEMEWALIWLGNAVLPSAEHQPIPTDPQDPEE